ncbi:hypothetical protein ATCC90586_003371 [Pythium insidiosum]|nr:hypothetical protein ATCC90586_003371 [Pythium insidiosum]
MRVIIPTALRRQILRQHGAALHSSHVSAFAQVARGHGLAAIRRAAAPAPLSSAAHAFSTASSSDNKKAPKKKLPSFVIDDAFASDDEGNDARDASQHDDDLDFGLDLGHDSDARETETEVDATGPATLAELSPDEQRALRKSFRIAMDRKREWMQRLASEGAVDALLRVVVDCYEPLYASLAAPPPCSLWDSVSDVAAARALATKFRSKWYDDQVTQVTEQEAMALLVQLQRPELALAVFRHREALAEALGPSVRVASPTAPDVLHDRVVELSSHVRSFWAWAMGAALMTRDYALVLSMYESALERGVFPTASMTASYAHALTASGEHDAAAALYEQCQQDDRPLNVFFFRQLLFSASVSHRGRLATQLLEDMKMKGFALRAVDFWNAIRAFDRAYFFVQPRRSGRAPRAVARQNDPNAAFFPVRESWAECQQRLDAEAKNPQATAARDEACEAVLQLVDDMVDGERLVPHTPQFFDRALAAAVFTREYDRVDELLELHRRSFDGAPVAGTTAVSMATNGLLLRGEPDRARDFVLSCDPALSTAYGKRAAASVVSYLCGIDDVPRLLALLGTLDSLKAQGSVVDESLRKALLATLCRSVEQLDDAALWATLRRWPGLFKMYSSPSSFTAVLEYACSARRWDVVAKCVQHRDKTVIRGVYPRLAIHLAKRMSEDEDDETSSSRYRALAALARHIDWPRCSAEQRVAFAALAIRALHALGETQRIARIVDSRLTPDDRLALPQDVKVIALDAATTIES